MGIAETAIAAAQQKHALTHGREIGDQRFTVFLVNLRAGRHLHQRVVAMAAGHLLAETRKAVLGADMLLEAVVDQRVAVVDRLDIDVAALAAIAAPGPAIFDELLAPERDAAIPAVSGLDIDLGDVEEFHRLPLSSPARGRGRKIPHLAKLSAWILLERGRAARQALTRLAALADLSRERERLSAQA